MVLQRNHVAINFYRSGTSKNIQQYLHSAFGRKNPENDRVKTTEDSADDRYFCARKKSVFHRKRLLGIKTFLQFGDYGVRHGRNLLAEMHQAADTGNVTD